MTDTSGIQYCEYDEYLWPANLSTEDDVITQYFSPAKGGLSEIHIRLAYNNGTLLKDYGTSIRVELKNKNGKVLGTWEPSESFLDNWRYFAIKAENLRKGDILI